MGLALLLAAFVMLVGVAGMVWGVTAAEEAWWLLLVGVIPLLLAAWFVAAFARYLQSAYVALGGDGVRVSYRPSIDTTIPFADIERADVVRHHIVYGLGIRTNLAGHVALATAWGPAAELTLRTPVRAGILPYIWWTHARTLRLTVERPEEFAADVIRRLDQQGEQG